MTISLAPGSRARFSEILSDLTAFLGEPVACVEPIGRGRNSQVYRLLCPSGRRTVLKQYFGEGSDGWDRCSVEFSCLTFLHAQGLTCVPQALQRDDAGEWALYAYIDGQPLGVSEVTEQEVDEAVEFLASLKRLGEKKESSAFGPASEACFSTEDLIRVIQQRLGRLLRGGQTDPRQEGFDPQQEEMVTFLHQEFLPALEQILRWCQAQLDEAGLSLGLAFPSEERTLSPSDFGFHNALKRDGRLVFLDFEYFGWDDPAKMAADFLLHPAMVLSREIKQRFISDFLLHFGAQGRLAKRLRVVTPLCGLKWCLLLLNEFVPQGFLRRNFSHRQTLRSSRLKAEQLAKAKRMLQTVQEGMRSEEGI